MVVKNIKITLSFRALLTLLTIIPITVTADVMVDPAWESRFQESEWVSLVRIESLNSLVNPSLSAESGLAVVQGYSYTLSVLQDWKSGSDDSVKLRVDLSDCPVLLALDNDYLVFASRNYRGQLQLQSCEHFVHAGEATPVVSLLNKLHSNDQAAIEH